MDSHVLWQVILGAFATAVITDVIVSLAKQSPRFLLAPYYRLWKESALLLQVLHNEDFAQWKPQVARYVALRAIKAQGTNQESPQPVLDLLESFLKRSEPVVLLGEPGAGKTTALQALTYRLARRAFLYDCLIWLALLIVTAVLSFAAPVVTIVTPVLSFAAPVFALGWLASFILWEPLVRRFTVPLFIEARSDYFGGDVNEWCEKNFRDRLGAKPLIGSRHRVALFIDGVNEVQASLFGGFVEGWRARLRDKRACRVIFTSRGGEENPAQRLSVETVLSVCDLDDDGVRELLKVYGREKAGKENKPYNVEQANRDFDELQEKNLLGEGSIGRNPYWLKMIVESGLYTVNRGALFRTFAEKLIHREIVEKPEELKRKPAWKVVPVDVEMDALAALALAMHQEKRIGFTNEEGWNKADRAICTSIGGLSYKLDDVLGEAEAATLLRVQLKKRIEFVHQLVQEFFAAFALHPESKWQEALAHCEDVWWWQTLFHMGGLAGAENSAQPHRYMDMQQRAVEALERIGAPSVAPLIALLKDEDQEVYWCAAEALVKIGALAVEPLISAFRRENKIVRRRAEEVLVKIGALSVEPLITALRDEDGGVRNCAAKALGRIGDTRAVKPLVTALRDNDVVRRSAEEALVRIGAPSVEALMATLQYYKDITSPILVRIGAPSVEPLIAALQDKNQHMHSIAEEALVRIGAPSVEPLITALRNEDERVRRTAAWELGRIGDARAVKPLIDALRDKNRRVCRVAAIALAQIGASSVAPLIYYALRDKDEFVRFITIETLREIGDARAIKPLITAFRDKDVDVRRNAVRALIKFGAPSVEPLIAALKDKSRHVRRGAAKALEQIGDARAVEPLIAALRHKDIDVRRSAEFALIKIGVPSVEPLIAALRDENKDVRWGAAEALEQIGDARALDELERIAQVDESETLWGSVANAAREAAEKIRQRQQRETQKKDDNWPRLC